MNASVKPEKLDPAKAARKGIPTLSPYIPGKPIREVRREYGLKKVVKLASNECPLQIPEHVAKAMVAQIRSISRYPDGHATELRQALAERFQLPMEAFLIGNGAEECIQLIGQTFLNPQDESLIPDPSFDAYRTSTALAGAAVTPVPLKDFAIDLDAVLEKVNDRTKIIWICSPNNPTGKAIARGAFESFLDRLPSDILVVLDQAYWEYAQPAQLADAMDYVLRDGRVIGIRTFSKVYGLAGIRVGYLIAHPAVVGLVSKVKLPFNVNVLAQAAALAAMQDQDFVRLHVRMIRQERDNLTKALEDRGMPVIPSETNFLFVRLPVNGDALFKRLLPKGIIIRPGSIFGMPEYMRLTIGAPEDNQEFLLQFDRTIQELREELRLDQA